MGIFAFDSNYLLSAIQELLTVVRVLPLRPVPVPYLSYPLQKEFSSVQLFRHGGPTLVEGAYGRLRFTSPLTGHILG